MSRPELTVVLGGHTPTVPSGQLVDELAGYFRMRRRLEPGLAATACRLIDPAELDRLGALVPRFARATDRDDAARREFETELVRPAATAWDLRILIPTWEDVPVLCRTPLAMDGIEASELTRYRRGCHELLSAYRTRNPVLVRAASLRYLTLAEQVVRLLAAFLTWDGRDEAGLNSGLRNHTVK